MTPLYEKMPDGRDVFIGFRKVLFMGGVFTDNHLGLRGCMLW